MGFPAGQKKGNELSQQTETASRLKKNCFTILGDVVGEFGFGVELNFSSERGWEKCKGGFVEGSCN